MAHVAKWKRERVQGLVDQMVNSQVVGIVDLHGIPAAQMISMRAGLRGKAEVSMTRNTLMDLAITEAAKKRPGLEQLRRMVEGQCAIVTTDENPFKLFRQMEGTKTPAPAKPGDIAPEDIVVKAGETPFKPGPIIGELQKAGIPAAIESGKIIIKKDKVLVPKGEPVPEEVAKVLAKLEILPMIVGMDLRAAFEDGVLYGKDVLNVPADYYTNLLGLAARNALGLSLSIAYVTPQTVTPLLSKAYREAMALSVASAFPTRESIGAILAKADAQMMTLASIIGLEDDRIKHRMAAVPAAKPVNEPKAAEAKKEEEEERVSEEEAAAGLSSLFD
ncbi:MAG TPA: 50S ribosomal protein L10 [Methanomassiliicoccales archaeon]|jgi:large subunit ribosomal protein L10|nr:50S ribosomal protein L10 [Methanomassiliicoccales archaeon]MCE5260642.1 50S ribosomal protein L10 [Euryarchaeota archaeon]HOE52094.1 50S ribosomal protein L10 [Methanomassiliicoccales archaeon]HOO03208.1 50S ribosomal protein L10 [Methanomassiliicoccales archaeon]HQM66969.1 50S ribosomal protein L10 [Methanomassiliicoccales archaeon]